MEGEEFVHEEQLIYFCAPDTVVFSSNIILANYSEYVKRNACGFHAKFCLYLLDLFDKIHRSFKM